MERETSTLVTKTKRRVSKACKQCHIAHSSCEDARPCKRCVDKGIGHLCEDNQKRQKDYSLLLEQTSSTISNIPTFTPTAQTAISDNREEVDLKTIEDLSPELQDFLMGLFSDEPEEHSVFGTNSDNQILPSIKKLLIQDMQIKYHQHLFSLTCNRLPEEFKELHFLLRTLGIQFQKNSKTSNIKRKSVKELASSIDMTIAQFSAFGDMQAAPTIIWDRHGVIYYVNSAYKQLTGLPFTLPTERSALAMFAHVFSLKTFLEFSLGSIRTLIDYPKNTQYNSLIIPASVKLHTKVGDKYIDGTMSVSLKQDNLGFAFLFIGNFLPSTTTTIRSEIPQF